MPKRKKNVPKQFTDLKLISLVILWQYRSADIKLILSYFKIETT